MRPKRFANPHIDDLRRSFWDFVLWQIGRYNEKSPREQAPPDFTYPKEPKAFMFGSPSAVWIGHSTYLIEVGGKTILTDPVWGKYCSPIPIHSLKRHSLPPIDLADLPEVDLVLLSHNHYDHLDRKTVLSLNRLYPQIEWVVPPNLSSWFHKRGIHAVTEIGWWDSLKMKGVKITAVPTQHFSGRGIWDKNKTHWNGYVFETGGKRVYFCGDTGYNDKDFKAIGNHFKTMDLSLLPIGTYVPEKFMQPVHISPFEAVQIHKEVNSQLSLGMHWNTFRLSDEPMNRPPYDLFLAMEKEGLNLETFLPVDIGTYVNF